MRDVHAIDPKATSLYYHDEEGSVTLVRIDDTGDIILEENWTKTLHTFNPSRTVLPKETKKPEDLQEKVNRLEKELKELKAQVNGMQKSPDLSMDRFRLFCQEHGSAGAYCSDVNYQKWKRAGGKMIFTQEDHHKASNSSTSGNYPRRKWSRGASSSSSYSYKRRDNSKFS